MARDRMNGEDKPFLDWCRRNPLLPATHDQKCGIAITDVDFCIHRFITAVDCIGTREVQSMMEIETKTHGKHPSRSQLDTLWKKHMTIRLSTKVGKETILNFGVAILIMDGESPDNSSSMKWCRFRPIAPRGIGCLACHDISVEQLVGLLRFDFHPDRLEDSWLRRHHAPKARSPSLFRAAVS